MVANSSELVKQRMEIRAAITLAMIVGTFIVLWSPGIISMFIMSITKNRDFHIDILELSTILVHLNAAIDPIIYAYRMNNIREALHKFFKCGKVSDNAQSSSGSGSGSNKTSIRITTAWAYIP